MKKIVFTLYILIHGFLLNAQIDNTMYFMDRLPQANYINTATVPECKFFIGGLIVPIVGQLPPPITFAVNTPLDYSDVFFKGRWEYSDSIITPLHPNANLDEFLNKLKNVNYLTTDLQLNLLYFGFKQKNNFFTFDLSERMLVQAGIPGDLIKFPLLGNGGLQNANIEGLHVNMFAYHQAAFGFKTQYSKYLSLGVRAKLLLGIANVYTSTAHLELNTQNQTNFIETSSNYVISTNLPLTVTLNNEGAISELEFVEMSADVIKENAMYTGNLGLALDAGFSKDWNSELTYFANIEDFGYIQWKKNASTFSTSDSVSTFKGIFEVIDGVTNNKLEELETKAKEYLENSNVAYSSESYKTSLPFKIYAGARYKVTPKFHVGALARFEKLTYGMRPSATVTANFRPGTFGSFTLSYSYINSNFNNIGLGYTLRLGPVQWYFVSDNLLGSALFPEQSRSFSMRMGCNLVFGYKGLEKPNKAIPMFNSSGENSYRKVPKSGQVNKKNKGTKTNKKYKAVGSPQN